MDHDASPKSTDASLYFVSTQIQARHEDHEHYEAQMSRIQRFKNTAKSPQSAVARPAHVSKPRPRPKPKPKSAHKNRPIKSISAFVRETLGSGGSGLKPRDTHTLLDQFMGDQKRLDAFLDEVQLATEKHTPHLLSKRNRCQPPTLFSEHEWKQFSENLRLRFPNLTHGNRKTLKTISRRLEDLKRAESATEVENSANSTQNVWSQASRQPSVDLSTEDLKWLYDLDEEHLDSDTSNYHNEEPQKSPFCLTLSQAVDDPARPHGFDVPSSENEDVSECENSHNIQANIACSQESGPIIIRDHTFSLLSDTMDPNLSTYIEDSEEDLEPISHAEFQALLAAAGSEPHGIFGSENTVSRKSDFFRQPNDSEPFSLAASLVFASSRKDTSRASKNGFSQLKSTESSPIKYPTQSPIQNFQQNNKPVIVSSSPDRFSSLRSAALPTPSCLRVDSSPLAHKQQVDSSPLFRKLQSASPSPIQGYVGTATTDDEVFLTARASMSRDAPSSPFEVCQSQRSESLDISPLKRKPGPRLKKRDFLKVAGSVELDPSISIRMGLKVVSVDPRPLSDDVIPDSQEEDDEFSIIEITKNDVDDPYRSAIAPVLQVPSSPENDYTTKPGAFQI